MVDTTNNVTIRPYSIADDDYDDDPSKQQKLSVYIY